MDKETLSQYGWVVICLIVLALLIALATPFGDYISEAISNATSALFDSAKDATAGTGVDLIAPGTSLVPEGTTVPNP
jgi:hypothetical protein